MIKEILYKLFNLEPFPCPTCEVLQIQLENAQRQNEKLLERLLAKDSPTGVPAETPVSTEEMAPVGPKFTPWRVRQAHFEQEDRAKAEIQRKNREEIELAKKRIADSGTVAQTQTNINKLEQELGIKEG
jgi:hypothetical protein